MEEGSRPLRFRGTPAAKHRHYFAVAVLLGSAGIACCMELSRNPKGLMGKLLKAKEDESTGNYMRQRSVFQHQFYGREKPLVATGKELNETQNEIASQFD